MEFGKLVTHIGIEFKYSIFEGKEINEYHLCLTSTPGKKLTDQISEIREAFAGFLTSHHLQKKNILFQRIFASDISNQSEEIKEISFCPAISSIQQPPLSGAKISTWIVLLQKVNGDPIDMKSVENEVVLNHNGYSHAILSQMQVSKNEGSFSQTEAIFNHYIACLKKENLTLAENCLRTWIFVRDIDNNYGGMVNARNEVFAKEGLSSETQYIASTGIEGQTQMVSSLVMMDAYSVGGLEPGQITYLESLENLSHTHKYGVAFERGTAIDYGDRRQIFISGTASIDCNGEILYLGDIEKQTDRVFDNIKALLLNAEADMEDVNSMIIYLRDRADSLFIENYLAKNYPKIPIVLVHAPVCRSGWLIEIECTAIKATYNPEFRNF